MASKEELLQANRQLQSAILEPKFVEYLFFKPDIEQEGITALNNKISLKNQ